MDDRALLDAYANHGSEESFGQLVERYGPMVYSACLRQVRDPALAEDTAQAVFMLLSEKARRISRSAVLAGWLCQTARLASSNARRMEGARRKHEQEAGRMNLETPPAQLTGHAEWEWMAPKIDGAMARLSAADRDAILLRYWEGRSNREVGRRLGLSENAAEKRVSRALERLRGVLRYMGVEMSADMLAAALPCAVFPAPAALLGRLKGIGKVGAAKGAGGAASQKIFQEARKAMQRIKLKIAALISAGVLALCGVGTYLVNAGEDAPAMKESSPPPAKEETPAAPAESHRKRMQLNVLEQLANQTHSGQNHKSRISIGTWRGAAISTLPDPYAPFQNKPRNFTSVRPYVRHSYEMTPRYGSARLPGPAADAQLLLYFYTEVNSDDRDGGPVIIERDGQVFKIILDEWRTPGVPKNHNVPVVRHHVLALGTLDSGGYEVRVERRTFASNEHGWPVHRFPLTSVEEAVTRFTVEKTGGDKAFMGDLDWKKKELPANAPGVLWQQPEQLAFMLSTKMANGAPGKLGLQVGTFDFKTWSAGDPQGFKDLPVLTNPRLGEPMYALILGPELSHGESMTLQDVCWEGNRAKIRVNLWRDRGPRSANYLFFPALLIPLYLSSDAQTAEKNPPKGEYFFEVAWQVLWAPRAGGLYEPVDEKHVNLQSMQNEANLKVEP